VVDGRNNVLCKGVQRSVAGLIATPWHCSTSVQQGTLKRRKKNCSHRLPRRAVDRAVVVAAAGIERDSSASLIEKILGD